MWNEKINTILSKKYWSEQRIADWITEKGFPVSQSTINRIKRGKTPSYDVGKSILELYKKIRKC